MSHSDGDNSSAITFSSAYENAARVAGIAGLNANAAVIAPKQPVVIGKRPARADRSFGRDDRAELCVLQRCLRKLGQIERKSGLDLNGSLPLVQRMLETERA